MQTLFLLIYRYRSFLIFVFLEVIAAWLITNNNSYQGALFFNSANAFTGRVNQTSSDVSGYFSLTNVNTDLAEENAFLRRELARLSLQAQGNRKADSVLLDSNQYVFVPAEIINKSTNRLLNFVTIDKGKEDGVMPDMGIMGQNGIVGKVKDVSDHYATAYTLIHTNLLTSVYHKASGAFASVQWDGIDPLRTKLMFLPRHVEINIGDSILTSGFNAVFPPDMLVGIVTAADLADNAVFYNADVALATDFASLKHVYFIKNYGRIEKDSLEQISIED
jgi:rod shape-determining protein MreC